MNIKKLLEGKDNLKEQLGMNVLKSGIFDDLLKTRRNSAQQIVLMKMEEKIFSMTGNEIIEYFDTTNMHAQITVFADDTEGARFVKYGFDIKKTNGDLISGISPAFDDRKEATVKCAEKLIELSN